MPRLQLSEWRAEQLRLSAFPVVGESQRSTDWWQRTVGTPPEETASSLKKGSSTLSSAFAGGKLTLQLEQERIDWRLTPPDLDLTNESLLAEPDLQTIGLFEEARAAFIVLAHRWLALPDLPEMARLAFGAVLLHKESSRRDGYQRLPEYVPIDVSPDSTDFMYQINHPVDSRTVPGLRINRLSKWAVGSFKMVALRLAHGEPRPAMSPNATFALRLELDINTAAEYRGALPRTELAKLFGELVEYGEGLTIDGVGTR
ncbi:MAG: hypothetical protein AB7H93_13350 [Vicinamibacterales bacterium]